MSDLLPKKEIKPAKEGWFRWQGSDPCLLGNQCLSCYTYYFPKATNFCRTPNCNSEELKEVPFSTEGTIWSYTNSCYKPPAPYISSDPFTPFAIAAVHLEKENLIVLGQLAKGVTVDDVSIGSKVKLIIETLFEDDTFEHVVWKWKPIDVEKADDQ